MKNSHRQKRAGTRKLYEAKKQVSYARLLPLGDGRGLSDKLLTSAGQVALD